jgi:MFS transporter, OFA family, oxalate/formate antiporter
MNETPQSSDSQGRWKIAVAGVAMQMILGTVYAWSVFKKPLLATHGPDGGLEGAWSEPGVGFTFTLTIFFLGLSAAVGGRFVDKAGSRRIATVAAVLFGIGTVLAGVADHIHSLWLLWIGYGVIAGIGNGLGYITPVAVLVRWFPDKKGLITGLAVMGFGLGAAVMGQLGPLMVKAWGIDNTFYIAGAVFLVGLLIAARKLVNPSSAWSSGAKPGQAAATQPLTVDVSGALRMPQFYILWLILFLNVTAGIALISNLSPMAQAQTKVGAVLAGTIVLATSLCNGFGRLFWGGLSEKLGRKTVFLLIFATQIPLFFMLPRVENVWLFSIMCCYILLCYGGGFGTMPSFTADTFGSKNIGSIYGKVLLAWGIAGAVGPMLMEWIKKTTGSFNTALTIAAVLLCAGLVVTALYRKPRAKATAQ